MFVTDFRIAPMAKTKAIVQKLHAAVTSLDAVVMVFVWIEVNTAMV